MEDELIHDLFTIFVSAKFASHVKFSQKNKELIDSFNYYLKRIWLKMTVLTFMEMTVENKKFPLIECNRNFRLELMMLKHFYWFSEKKNGLLQS